MRTSKTIIEVINTVFRSCFKDLKTWSPWITVLKALFGLKLTRKEFSLYRACTGREKRPHGEFRELWAVVGRRGGKSYIAATIACFLALFYDFSQYLTKGELATIQVIAADRSQARIIFRYISAILHSNAILEQYIVNETAESILLSTDVEIVIQTCSFRTIRGRTVVCAIFDETAYWQTGEGANPDREILTAVRPAMATIPNSKLIVCSSPYAKTGILYDHFKQFYGSDDPNILVWQGPSKTMNPLLDQKMIDREAAKDPSAARAEWFATFRDDLEDLLTTQVVDALVVPGRSQLPYSHEHIYEAFVDPSGGRGDAFTLAIGHYEDKRGKYVLDLLYAWEPPFSPDDVVAEIIGILAQYDIVEVTGDNYSGEWVRTAFEHRAITYHVCKRPKSDLYLGFVAVANSQKAELLDDPELTDELKQLERRRGKTGKDTVDHPPRGHDDRANAVAGVCHVLRQYEEFGDDGIMPRFLTVWEEDPFFDQRIRHDPRDGGHWITLKKFD